MERMQPSQNAATRHDGQENAQNAQSQPVETTSGDSGVSEMSAPPPYYFYPPSTLNNDVPLELEDPRPQLTQMWDQGFREQLLAAQDQGEEDPSQRESQKVEASQQSFTTPQHAQHHPHLQPRTPQNQGAAGGANPPHGGRIDPAIDASYSRMARAVAGGPSHAGGQMDAEHDLSTPEERSASKRELSGSKRAAQNRAAQVSDLFRLELSATLVCRVGWAD